MVTHQHGILRTFGRSLAALLPLLLVQCGGTGTKADATSGALCDQYHEACPNDALGNVFITVCKEECAKGVVPAYEYLRESTCWKAYCLLEMDQCLAGTDAQQKALIDCAADHGWLKE